MLAARILRFLAIGTGLTAGLARAAFAQEGPAQPLLVTARPTFAPAPPKLLVKAGARLSHLLYVPGSRSWQLVLPTSCGLEYRLRPQLSLYAQAEADISAGRARRRGAGPVPPATTDLSGGVRYYLAPPSATVPWGSYVALEGSAALVRVGARGRGPGSRPTARFSPGLFAFCGAQQRGPGRRLLCDANVGLGVQAPPPYAADGVRRPPWEVAAQVNLRVCCVRQPRRGRG